MSAIDSKPLLSNSGADPFPAFSQRRRRGVRVTAAAAVALGLVVSGGAVAGASTPTTAPSAAAGAPARSGHGPFGGSPPTAVGKVTSVGSGTFTLSTRDNTTVTVTVSNATTYLDRDVTSPTIANVTVGEQAAVFGTGTSTSVSATKVAIGVPVGVPGTPGKGTPGGGGGPGRMGGTPPAAVGKVTSVGSGTFTLSTRDNTTVTVTVSSATTYFDRDVTSPTIANVTVGEQVAVFGTDTSDAVTATKVAIGLPAGGPGGPQGADGGPAGGPQGPRPGGPNWGAGSPSE